MGELREFLKLVHDEIWRAAREQVRPFTRGGKLDLSSPNIVGHLPASRGGTGGESPIPDPYAYVVDSDGAYLTDGGIFLAEYDA